MVHDREPRAASPCAARFHLRIPSRLNGRCSSSGQAAPRSSAIAWRTSSRCSSAATRCLSLTHHADRAHPAGRQSGASGVDDAEQRGASSKVARVQQPRFGFDRRHDRRRPRAADPCRAPRPGPPAADVNSTSRSCRRPSESCAAFNVRSGRASTREAGLGRDLQDVAQLLDGDADLVQGLGVIQACPFARCGRAGPDARASEAPGQRLPPGVVAGLGASGRRTPRARARGRAADRARAPCAARVRAPAPVARAGPARPRARRSASAPRSATRRSSPAATSSSRTGPSARVRSRRSAAQRLETDVVEATPEHGHDLAQPS